jgi:hypothetical protein
MTMQSCVLAALACGPKTRAQLEVALAHAGYAPAGVTVALWELKKAGKVAHLVRGGRGRTSLYGRTEGDRT